MRHLILLDHHGFSVRNAVVGELGPGDSIGTGLAALLFGASRYVGLDLIPFSAKANVEHIGRELETLYLTEASVPDHHEFPGVIPRLTSYEFPRQLIDASSVQKIAASAIGDLAGGLSTGTHVEYVAPWTSVDAIANASRDLLFSQAVLQFADGLDTLCQTQTLFTWMKPGGYCSHFIGCSAMYLSPFWNGHRAYSDLSGESSAVAVHICTIVNRRKPTRHSPERPASRCCRSSETMAATACRSRHFFFGFEGWQRRISRHAG